MPNHRFPTEEEQAINEGAVPLVDETEVLSPELEAEDPDICRMREYDEADWSRGSAANGNAANNELLAFGADARTASSMALNGPFKGLNLTRCNSSALLLEQLARNIPINQYGLPVFIYRPDMLDLDGIRRSLLRTTFPSAQCGGPEASYLSMTDCLGMLDAATVPLSYDEGYPVAPSGYPLWQRLDYETSEAYDAFLAYLELPGVRQLVDMSTYPLEDLQEYSRLYYWPMRVKAYDLFRQAHHQKTKLQRMMNTEDTHFQLANRLMRKVADYLEVAAFDDDNLSPEKAVNMLEKLVKIQRISAGLPANGESKENTDLRSAPPVQVIMQQISQTGNAETKNTGNTVLDMLRNNPDAIDKAQDLIVQVMHGDKEAS